MGKNKIIFIGCLIILLPIIYLSYIKNKSTLEDENDMYTMNTDIVDYSPDGTYYEELPDDMVDLNKFSEENRKLFTITEDAPPEYIFLDPDKTIIALFMRSITTPYYGWYGEDNMECISKELADYVINCGNIAIEEQEKKYKIGDVISKAYAPFSKSLITVSISYDNPVYVECENNNFKKFEIEQTIFECYDSYLNGELIEEMTELEMCRGNMVRYIVDQKGKKYYEYSFDENIYKFEIDKDSVIKEVVVGLPENEDEKPDGYHYFNFLRTIALD